MKTIALWMAVLAASLSLQAPHAAAQIARDVVGQDDRPPRFPGGVLPGYARTNVDLGIGWTEYTPSSGLLAIDIGVGADGSVWVIDRNGRAHYLDGADWVLADGFDPNNRYWKIDVDVNGLPWVTTQYGDVRQGTLDDIGWRWSDRQGFPQFRVGARSGGAVSAGHALWGPLWAVYGDQAFYWRDGMRGWEATERIVDPESRTASQGPYQIDNIDVAPDGLAWVVAERGVWRRFPGALPGNGWERLPGDDAADVSVGADGTAWMIGDGPVRYWAGNTWVDDPQQPGIARAIDVGPDGLPWIVTSDGRIWRRSPAASSTPAPRSGGEANRRILIQGGTYVMGTYGDPNEDAYPAHQVTVSSFWIQEHEVTNEEYYRFDPTHSFVTSAPRDPVGNVSWAQAMAYAASLGGSLPTEAQWEFAARGTAGRTYPWGEAKPDCTRAHFGPCPGGGDNGGGNPVPVMSRPQGATPEGVHDLAGNMGEWVQDRMARYGSGPLVDPLTPSLANDAPHVYRGGAWGGSQRGDLRATSRAYSGPPAPYIGFRVAWPAEQAASNPPTPTAPPPAPPGLGIAWEPVSIGPMTGVQDIVIGSDGGVWALDFQRRIWREVNGSWSQMQTPAPPVGFDVFGGDLVWIVIDRPTDPIRVEHGPSWSVGAPDYGSWEAFPSDGNRASVRVAQFSFPWAVSVQGDLWQYASGSPPVWAPPPPGLRVQRVDAFESYDAWLVLTDGRLFYITGDKARPNANGWGFGVDGVIDVAAGPRGAAWLATQRGVEYLANGRAYPADWRGGPLRAIDVGPDNDPWVVTALGQLWRAVRP